MNETLFGRDMIRNLHVYVWKLPIYRDNTRPGNFTWLPVRYAGNSTPFQFSGRPDVAGTELCSTLDFSGTTS